jgi:hypothetical protein
MFEGDHVGHKRRLGPDGTGLLFISRQTCL